MIPSHNVRSRTDMTKTDKGSDEPEFDGDNVQLNVDQQSYGEQSITDNRENVTKNCDREITKEQKNKRTNIKHNERKPKGF